MSEGLRLPALLAALYLGCAEASLLAQDRPQVRASRTVLPPRIDGALDDAAWAGPALTLGDWKSYNPVRGESGPERTEVHVVYDDRYVYFAFQCLSTDPASIRTTFSRRDTVFSDDWIGLSLDSVGTGQSAYHLMVNPSGIQMDAVNTQAAGERFETDFLWASAGQRTAQGYAVEIALPLQSIRFAGGRDVAMGILFWRNVSRAGMSYSWPELLPGQWVFDRHARLSFPELEPRRLFELLPTVTLPLSQTRTTPGRWSEVAGGPDAGLSVKYGITSQVTADATVNPDFSQVESDAFQVQVNQRFPIFFSERRPFFMEGMGLFSLAGTGGDSNMRLAVHTRRIVNPAWGAKLTGTAGRASFGVLEASDAAPDLSTAPVDASEGDRKLFTIGRVMYGLGGSSYAGVIVTDTAHAGRRNQVIGADLFLRPTPSQGVSVSVLSSSTDRRGGPGTAGRAAHAAYSYNTRRVSAYTQVDHYDRAFQMDTAFYNRTGFTSAFTYAEANFYPKAPNRLGIIRWGPLVVAKRGEDRLQGGDEGFLFAGTAIHFRRQGFLRAQRGSGHERWKGRRFETGEPFSAFGGVQLFRWLRLRGHIVPSADAVFYDQTAPLQGRTTSAGINVTWQPTAHFSQSASYDPVRFRRADTGARLYSVDIVNLRTIYQFDRRFFIRLLAQYDGSRPQWLTDLLASYELVPGTALYAGYGALYERQGVEAGPFAPRTGSYLTVRRGLFFKASYLHRF